ncbi:hypothetical protein KA517_00415 [Candidatus Gracilibacteria bacterium]|nr:hypothetical protein [Candidatus Gracilibacteria bacterium]
MTTNTVKPPEQYKAPVDDAFFRPSVLPPFTVRGMLDDVLHRMTLENELRTRKDVSRMLGGELLKREVTSHTRFPLSTAVRGVRTRFEARIARETGLLAVDVYEALRDPSSENAKLLSARYKIRLEVLRALNDALHY